MIISIESFPEMDRNGRYTPTLRITTKKKDIYAAEFWRGDLSYYTEEEAEFIGYETFGLVIQAVLKGR